MPSYFSLNPEQRYVYLTWLQDVTKDIDVGYKFLFYYGLERWLLIGKFEKAFDMILRLRKTTANNSFLGYSGSALFYSTVKTENEDLLDKLRFLFEDEIWHDKQIMLKLFTQEPIEPHEIPKILKSLDVNKRYLDEKIYIGQMQQLLSEKYGHSYLLPEDILDEDNDDNYTECDVPVFANFSLPLHIRVASKVMHPILDDFFSTLTELHKTCHETTKAKLAENRKKK